MKILILISILLSTNLFAQQSVEWINSLENPDYPKFNELKAENELAKYAQYDLSDLLKPNSEFLGFIGLDYQRIYVSFKSVTKSKNTPNLYYTTGETTVSNNTCDFEGTITIEQFREFKNMYYGVDSIFLETGIKAQGIAIGTYKFSENPNQKHVGSFQGIMTLWWYLDKNGEIQFYDLNSHSDRYKNNQYIGTWKEYGKSSSKICNWGEYRIPFSDNLDIGAGEFSANPKYHDKGWEEF